MRMTLKIRERDKGQEADNLPELHLKYLGDVVHADWELRGTTVLHTQERHLPAWQSFMSREYSYVWPRANGEKRRLCWIWVATALIYPAL